MKMKEFLMVVLRANAAVDCTNKVPFGVAGKTVTLYPPASTLSGKTATVDDILEVCLLGAENGVEASQFVGFYNRQVELMVRYLVFQFES